MCVCVCVNIGLPCHISVYVLCVRMHVCECAFVHMYVHKIRFKTHLYKYG